MVKQQVVIPWEAENLLYFYQTEVTRSISRKTLSLKIGLSLEKIYFCKGEILSSCICLSMFAASVTSLSINMGEACCGLTIVFAFSSLMLLKNPHFWAGSGVAISQFYIPLTSSPSGIKNSTNLSNYCYDQRLTCLALAKALPLQSYQHMHPP